jgi:hypothetical protein
MVADLRHMGRHCSDFTAVLPSVENRSVHHLIDGIELHIDGVGLLGDQVHILQGLLLETLGAVGQKPRQIGTLCEAESLTDRRRLS